MSMLPERMPGDGERYRWIEESELAGRVVRSSGELQRMINASPGILEELGGVLKLRERNERGANIYWGSFRMVAYECNNPQKSCGIVIGPPEIKDDTSIHDGHFLAGRSGFDVYCRNCGHKLYEMTWEIS